MIWRKSCGTAAKAGRNRENKLRPVVTEGSYLLEHPTISRTYEILKQVQDDKIRLFTEPS